MITQKEYETTEIKRAIARFEENEKTRGNEAKESFEELLSVDPEAVEARIEWLLNGSFGYGEMIIAKRILERRESSKRYNWRAALMQLYANFDFLCPTRYTRKAWNTWTKDKQDKITEAVNNAVKAWEMIETEAGHYAEPEEERIYYE